MAARWHVPAGLHVASASLPDEGELPSLDGATGWLNSPPLTRAELRGRRYGVLFLESSPYITGEILHIDGGQVAGH